MIKKLFSISNRITVEQINRVYDQNLEQVVYNFANFEIEWLQNAYNEHKDIDKYLIFVKLIHKTLLTYSRHFYKVNFDDFYKKSDIEIEKISIIDLVKSLSMSKETVRRKLNELSEEGVLTRKLKNIRINKVNSNARLERNVFNLSKLIFLLTSKLGNCAGKTLGSFSVSS